MQETGGYFRKQHPIIWFATQSQRLKWPKHNVLTKSAAVNCFSLQLRLLVHFISIPKGNLLSILIVSYHISYFLSQN